MEKPQSNEFRYERKYLIQHLDKNTIINLVLMHPAFFSEIFYERWVNNIYYDFATLDNFMDNINGNTERNKYRIRWYGEMIKYVEDAKLEIKAKRGIVGFKKIFDLLPFHLNNEITGKVLASVFNNSSIDDKTKWILGEQVPVLLNRYQRRYFATKDNKFRITVDYNQSFFKIDSINNSFLKKYIDNENIILELKYDKEYDIEASDIANKLPFRMTKSSKFSRGIQLLYY